MNRGTGGNRGRGGDRRGGAIGGRYYTHQRRSQRPTDHDTVRRGTIDPYPKPCSICCEFEAIIVTYTGVAEGQINKVMPRSCRGPGVFYQPGYRDGAKLHLKMMCLGKNWDPETRQYIDKRPIDQAKPPPIPNDFQQLVREAIAECHRFLELDSSVGNARGIFPSMSPNICIINFYTKTGKLGLHQDKDESQESIRRGLPVVSISLGDTAEFQFGDQRDIDKAETVDLESGDVLIFGGASRLVFHGVSSIKSGTAPKPLLEVSGLRPGRLNLTFREY